MQRSFIEAQFPEALLSAECCKERRANHGQRLTGLGKWWGRKPLVLARALVLGMLLPVTSNPDLDLEVFLRLMAMDPDGLALRRKPIPLIDIHSRLTDAERSRYFQPRKTRLLNPDTKPELERIVFERMSYEERLTYCQRTDDCPNPGKESWRVINSHLGTTAENLGQLVGQLSMRRFGRRICIGDAFCGGGALVFEAARLGCNVVANDANPVASLLTWGALNLLGGGESVCRDLEEAQQQILTRATRQIDEWQIESYDRGGRGSIYFYCSEIQCANCGWMVPLATTWILGERTRSVVKLLPDTSEKRFVFKVINVASEEELRLAKQGTINNTKLTCPACGCAESITKRRRTEPPRKWSDKQLTPGKDDLFQERLYAIRWTLPNGEKQYAAPTSKDLHRENRLHQILRRNFEDWQRSGFLPSSPIPQRGETLRLTTEHGWTQWHQVFHPRQLLTHGLIASIAFGEGFQTAPQTTRAGLLLWLGMMANRDCKLAGWVPSWGVENTDQVFTNNALNTRFNRAARGISGFDSMMNLKPLKAPIKSQIEVKCRRAEDTKLSADLWITDPPYADAVAYDQLSEFFACWYEKLLPDIFPEWKKPQKITTASAKLTEAYKNLAEQMPPDGLHAMLFAHPRRAQWEVLATMLPKAGLRVTACWCIATDSSSAIRHGRRLDGTIVLILRHAQRSQSGYFEEVVDELRTEVASRLLALESSESADHRKLLESDALAQTWPIALQAATNHTDLDSGKLFEIAEKAAHDFFAKTRPATKASGKSPRSSP